METPAVVKQRIETWMLRVIEAKSYLQFEDLHIDEIDSEYRNPHSWLKGGIRCFQAALSIRTSRGFAFTVGLGFSLKCGPDRKGITFSRLEDVQAELDDSPPSLYLFDASGHPWFEDSDYVELGGEYGIAHNFRTRAYYREWRDENDNEFRRALWLLG